jgi:hypothetical protein
LIKPKVKWDCSNGHQVGTVGFEDCFDRIGDPQQRAENAAKQHWNRDYPFLAHKNLKCSTNVECADYRTLVGGAITVLPRSYIYSSEIQFVKPSSAKVTIEGNSNTQMVKGLLHFEYIHKTHDLRINSMHISIDPFSTDHGNFSDIGIYLLETSMAHCKGFTVVDTPCNNYEFKPSTLFFAENFKRNGKPHLFVSENSTLMIITIDHPSRTFTIKGNLASAAEVNGDTLPINVDLNLVGKFVNFAPVPLTDESDTFSQCIEGTNMNLIQLNAAGSYDVYEPLPTHQAAYKWIEDYGMLTEKPWGQGKLVTIGKGQLAFGAHDITLMVEDAHGVADYTTLQVQVADTMPPRLTVPADVYMLFLEDPGRVKVPIGMAYGADICAGDVMVTNNAPKDLLFPPNKITKIIWRAEDLRGNAVTGTQNIHVMVLKPFLSQFERAVYLINEGLYQSQFELHKCGDTGKCFVDMRPLASGFDQLIYLAAEVELPERQKTVLRQMVLRLEPIWASIVKAQSMLDRSNESPIERAKLRESAREAVRTALVLISNITE